MSKELNVVLKKLKLSTKTVFSISSSLEVFRREIKGFVRLDYMVGYKAKKLKMFKVQNLMI